MKKGGKKVVRGGEMGYNGWSFAVGHLGRGRKNPKRMNTERGKEPIMKSGLGRKGVALVVFLLICGSVYGKPWPGSGDANDPYQIHNAQQMQAIGADANYWGAHFRLMKDIDLGEYTGTSFNIIGNYDYRFEGVFDGDGHAIRNFNYSSESGRIGLFGHIKSDAEIKNLVLIDPNVDGGEDGWSIGALVGQIYDGTVRNCRVMGGVVKGRSAVGGLVGGSNGYIANCEALTEVTGALRTGGLVGYVTHRGKLEGCYSGGDVNGGYKVGGLVGNIESDGIITNINNCYSEGSVTGVDVVGGLVGFMKVGVISNSYSSASVAGTDMVGGLVGEGTMSNYIGCFWDSDVNPGLNGIGDTTDANVIGLPTVEMQSKDTYWFWGCGGVWTIDDGNDYPRLAREGKAGEVIDSGCGTEEEPYLIYEVLHMQMIGANKVNWDKHYRLMVDIDLGGIDFSPLGNSSYPFRGVFDGNGHTISNFTYDSNQGICGGLFGYIDDPNAEVKNLGLIGPNVDAGTGQYIGGLVGLLEEGSVSGCYIEGGSVSGYGSVGGLVGENRVGHITSCYSTCGVSGVTEVGGLVGLNEYGDIQGCYSTGNVIGEYSVAGLVGRDHYGTISNCYVESNVSGSAGVGGLVGHGDGSISGCYSTGTVSGEDYVGGISGTNNKKVANSYSMCSVTGESFVGGLIGHNSGRIYYCYSIGNILGIADVGGLVGYSSTAAVGSYWNTETSGIDYSATGRGLTTAEMQDYDSFISWGSDGSWTIEDGYDYPRLFWEESGGEIISTQLSDFIGGSGSEAQPFVLYTAEELNLIGLFMSEWDKHFALMADIDLSTYTGMEFNVIGHNHNAFKGVFNGNGYTISNLTYDCNRFAYIGLFGYIDDPNAEVKDVRLASPNINGGDYVGSLAGHLVGIITNCYVEGGSVSGAQRVGGLIGYNEGDISYCSSKSSVSGTVSVGGVNGSNGGDILSCSSTSSVSGRWGVGGLNGSNGKNIHNCSSKSSVSGTERVGGLIGSNGSIGGGVSQCYSTGSVIGDSQVGGLAGYSSYGSIFNSHSSSNVTGEEDVGGLVGHYGGWYGSNIASCYSTGSVTGGNFVGGLVGYDNYYYGDYTSCFWDSDVNPDVNGIGNTTDPNVIGLPTALMQAESTFTNAGWDFVGEVINGTEDIWKMNCEGMSYPKLSWWEAALGDFVCPDGVDMFDFGVLGDAWMSGPGDGHWDAGCDISRPNDDVIDGRDLGVFVGNWLEGM
jgi:hypothetical protein